MCGMAKGHALIQSQRISRGSYTPMEWIEHDFVSGASGSEKGGARQDQQKEHRAAAAVGQRQKQKSA
jgi:hypothetical protein